MNSPRSQRNDQLRKLAIEWLERRQMFATDTSLTIDRLETIAIDNNVTQAALTNSLSSDGLDGAMPIVFSFQRSQEFTWHADSGQRALIELPIVDAGFFAGAENYSAIALTYPYQYLQIDLLNTYRSAALESVTDSVVYDRPLSEEAVQPLVAIESTVDSGYRVSVTDVVPATNTEDTAPKYLNATISPTPNQSGLSSPATQVEYATLIFYPNPSGGTTVLSGGYAFDWLSSSIGDSLTPDSNSTPSTNTPPIGTPPTGTPSNPPLTNGAGAGGSKSEEPVRLSPQELPPEVTEKLAPSINPPIHGERSTSDASGRSTAPRWLDISSDHIGRSTAGLASSAESNLVGATAESIPLAAVAAVEPSMNDTAAMESAGRLFKEGSSKPLEERWRAKQMVRLSSAAFLISRASDASKTTESLDQPSTAGAESLALPPRDDQQVTSVDDQPQPSSRSKAIVLTALIAEPASAADSVVADSVVDESDGVASDEEATRHALSSVAVIVDQMAGTPLGILSVVGSVTLVARLSDTKRAASRPEQA